MPDYDDIGWDDERAKGSKVPLTPAQDRARRRKERGSSLIHASDHFCLLMSYAKMPNPKRKHNCWPVHLALIEVAKAGKYPTRIRQTDKAIKQIVILDYNLPTRGSNAPRIKKGSFNRLAAAHSSRVESLCEMVDEFERLWPVHFLSKKWPLPWPVYPHRRQHYS